MNLYMDTPTYSPPPLTSQPHSNKRLLYISLIAGLVAVVIIAITALPSVRTSLALRGIEFASNGYAAGPIFKVGLFGLKEISLPSGTVDYAKAGNHRVVVTDTGQVTVLGSGPKVVADSPSRKAAVAIHPAGTFIAYAESQEASPNIAAWTVHLVDVESAQTLDLGPGFAPAFFTSNGKDYLAFTSPTGITFMDIAARTALTLPLNNVSGTRYAAAVSPDGAYIAMPNALTGKYDLFARIESDNTIRLSAVGSTDSGLSDVAWKNGTLYGVTEPMNGKVGVVRIEPASPQYAEPLYSFMSEEFYRLIP